MKQLLVYLFITTVFFCNAQESTLVKTNINGELKISVPQTFKALSEQDVVQQYGVARVPEAVYNDTIVDDVVLSIGVRVDSINSTINYKGIKGSSDSVDLVIEKSFYKAALSGHYAEVKFIHDEVTMINNRQFMLFEFTSVLDGKNGKGTSIISKQYNYIAHGFKGKKKFIITFACPLDQQEKWQPVAQEIIKSITL